MSTNIANKTWEPIICIWGEVHFLTVSSKIIVTQDGDRGSIGENRNKEENINDLHWLFFGQNHHLQYDNITTGIIYDFNVFKDKDKDVQKDKENNLQCFLGGELAVRIVPIVDYCSATTGRSIIIVFFYYCFQFH